MKWLEEIILVCVCVCVCVLPSHLGLVPLFSLCDVLGGDALILHADVPQSSSQVGFGHVHLDLDLSVLHLALQLADLLRGDGRTTVNDKREDIFLYPCPLYPIRTENSTKTQSCLLVTALSGDYVLT